MELSIDRSRTFRESDYPNRPECYVPSKHFGQQCKEDERFLTGDVINACITEGDLRNNGDGCGCFRKEWGDGVAFYLIVGFHEKGYRIVITGWPHLHDREKAERSGEWSTSELDDIEAFNESYYDKFSDQFPEYSEWLKSEYDVTAKT